MLNENQVIAIRDRLNVQQKELQAKALKQWLGNYEYIIFTQINAQLEILKAILEDD